MVLLITALLTLVAYLVMSAALEREFMDRLRVGAESTIASREIIEQKVLAYSDLLAKREAIAAAVAGNEAERLEALLTEEYPFTINDSDLRPGIQHSNRALHVLGRDQVVSIERKDVFTPGF